MPKIFTYSTLLGIAAKSRTQATHEAPTNPMTLLHTASATPTRSAQPFSLPAIEEAADPRAHLPGRLRSLDVLRAVAVIAVIVHHWGQGQSGPIADLVARVGWAGVDLFFVLSGFLVSGLIFREHQRHGSFRAGRFLVRRGLKIYPAFYVFLAVSVVCARFIIPEGRDLLPNRLADFFFIQNYAQGLWTHTWSLGVEEHFYVLLALVATVVLPRIRPSSRVVLGSIGVVAVACLAMRIATAAASGYSWRALYIPTHLRIDSLLIGVGLAYLWHYRRQRLVAVATTYRWWLAAAGVALVAPLVVLERSHPLMYTAGLTSLALGFGLILLVTLTIDDRWAPRPIAYLGQFSYTTYLWHMPMMIVVAKLLPVSSKWAILALDLIVGFGVGIVAARVVEMPALRLRDRLFPSRGEALATNVLGSSSPE